MTVDERILDIKAHPEQHQHSFDGLVRCCMNDGAINTAIMQAHEDYAPQGVNGGRRCDVSRGPCSCGAWH